MGFNLESVVQEIVADDIAISSDYTSNTIDISGIEDDFAIQFIWSGGSTPDFDLALETSLDGINWFATADATPNITADSGNYLWDLEEKGAVFIRVTVTRTYVQKYTLN